MKNISAVIFDMDGLMFDTEKLALDAWKEVGSKAGYHITDDIMLASVGRNKIDTGIIMRQHLGEFFPFDELCIKATDHSKDYIKCNGMPMKPGLLELLDFLKEKGIKTAVATSTERVKAEEHLNSCNILQRFDCTVCGDEVERGKPEPDIFLLAAKKLSCRPEACVVLEDSAYGIMAAYKAGMRPIMIPDLIVPNDEIKDMTHQIYQSLNDVIGYFENQERE